MMNRHAGAPAVVLGNGPSRSAPRIPPSAVLIGCNRGGWVTPALDYCVILDIHGMRFYATHTETALAKRFVCEPIWQTTRPKTVAPFIIFKPDVLGYHRRMFSGPYALLFAMWLGCDPICYAGFNEAGNYFDAFDDLRYEYKYPKSLPMRTREWIAAFSKTLGHLPVFINLGGGDAF